MAQSLYVRKRLTRKYVGTWRHLDRWAEPVEVKLIPSGKPRRPAEDADPSEGSTYFYRVIAKAGTKADLTGAIRDQLSHQGCSHEHDCCGCSSAWAEVQRVSRREYKVAVSISYNY